MRQFVPGMSHSRGMFSLAQLNAVASHEAWSMDTTLAAPMHAMPNRVRSLFGVDLIMKQIEEAKGKPKAQSRSKMIKAAALCACSRVLPGSLPMITMIDSLDDCKDMQTAHALIEKDSSISDRADAVLLSAYGAVVALEVSAMLQGCLQPSSSEGSTTEHRNGTVWSQLENSLARAGAIDPDQIFPRKVAATMCDCSSPEAGSGSVDIAQAVRLVFAGAIVQSLGIPLSALSSASKTNMEAHGSSCDDSVCISQTMEELLLLQPRADELAQGSEALLSNSSLLSLSREAALPGRVAKKAKSKAR